MAGRHPASLREQQQCGQLCPDRFLAGTAFGLAPGGDQTTMFWSHKQQHLWLQIASGVSPVEACLWSEI